MQYMEIRMKSPKQIIIWGGMGQAKVLHQLIRQTNFGQVCAVFDNNPNITPPLQNIPLYYGLDSYKDFIQTTHDKSNYMGIVAVASGHRGKDRIAFLEIFQKDGLHTPNLIHKQATILSPIHHSMQEYGIQILANSMIGVEVQLGKGVIVNSLANIEHECIIGNGVHIAPSATLCGGVKVGDYSFIGANAVVLPHLVIGKNVIVGAGSVVTKNIPDNSIVYGNPARIKPSS
ncbi:NeuD/PglB/VioB family sugar acetyltransferase [Helicobacter fennelliae]|nr:NeuD/PglB/VioB family sugar acetyltransferase [Helicobacter fennelliae]